MAIDKEHIENIFEQQFSLLDHRKMNEYFNDKVLNEETKLIIKDQWNHFEPDPAMHINLDHVFYKLFYTINEKNRGISGKNLFLRISQIAAILIVGILIAAGIYFSERSHIPAHDQQVEFISHNGFRNQFKLPDGTSGWLGYDSQLKYYVDSSNNRIAVLDGLAFFDVVHRKIQPFIVKTPKNLNIEVLGTRFNVSAYSADKSCEVVLEKGRVRLNLKDKKIEEMIPNERIVYNSGKRTIQKSMVNVKDYLAWKEGKLILNDISLEETCKKISRFYNIEIELQARNINQQQVRLVLEDETLEETLNLLCMILPVKYEVEGRKALGNNSYSKKKIIIKNK